MDVERQAPALVQQSVHVLPGGAAVQGLLVLAASLLLAQPKIGVSGLYLFQGIQIVFPFTQKFDWLYK